MEKQLVSIIVPIYNVEIYLDNCVQSLLDQTYTNIEIVLVDDGSQDGCGTKCDIWKQRDSRIKVIHKNNTGLGMARNSGIDVATGKYVVFIDSDDWADKNMIKRLLNTAIEYGADTVLCNFIRSYSNGNEIKVLQKYRKEVSQGKDVINDILLEMIGTQPFEERDFNLYMSVWHGLYSLDLIHSYGIRFPSERQYISEDIIFDVDYFSKSNKVICIPDCLYYYRENEKSLSSMYNPVRFKKEAILFIEVQRKLAEILNKNQYKYRAERMFLGRVRSCIMRSTSCGFSQAKNEIEMICDNSIVKQVLSQYPYQKNPFSQRVFNFCLKNRMIFLVWVLAKIVAKRNLRG